MTDRGARMRRLAAEVPVVARIALPLAVVAAAAATLFLDGMPRWADFAATVGCALVAGAALEALDRIRRRHPRALTGREVIAAFVLAIAGAVWTAGTVGVGLGAAVFSIWFVDGMFATAVAIGVLLYSATRRPAPPVERTPE